LLGDRGAAALAGAGVTVRDRPGGVAIEYATQPLNERAAVSARELVRRCEATSCAVAMLGPPSARLWLQLVLDKTLRGQLTGASFHRFAEAAGALFEDLRRTSPSMALPTIREQAGGLSISAAPGDSVEASTKLAMILRARLVEAFRVPSSSMVPTLQANDQIFVGKGQLLGDVAPGDLVAYKQEGRIYIKRYLAGPGQTVTETDAGLSVDGKPLAIEVVDRAYHYRDQDEVEGAVDRSGALVREHLGSRSYLTVRTGPPHSKDTWKVPPDHVFFIGDNRNNSNDSRYLGASPKDAIVGRVLCTWFALRDRLPDWDRIGIALE
jgi:signal peptidase I